MEKYCPACYMNFETDEDVCPKCGTALEDPLTDEEADQYLEILTSIQA